MSFDRRKFFSAAAGALAAGALEAAEPGWISLINGNSLAGWRAEGKASWRVEDGTIVGAGAPGGTGGDLFTERQWTDFELEAEWKMRWPGNSGIWLRSSAPRTGYQVDFLDQPSHPGILSGSLYCMGKAFIAENRDPATFNKDGWNRLRIRAAGDHIMVEQNGAKVVDVRDGSFPGPGSIGIQVHTGKAFDGMEVRVRGLRLRPLH